MRPSSSKATVEDRAEGMVTVVEWARRPRSVVEVVPGAPSVRTRGLYTETSDRFSAAAPLVNVTSTRLPTVAGAELGSIRTS